MIGKEIDKDSCTLDSLKGAYEEFRKKYDLPEFYELNKLFDIEDIDVDTDFLLRRIRRIIAERITGYSRFVDIILNPSNAPVFFFKLLKKLDSKDKDVLSRMYEILGNIEIEILSLDLDYSEEKESIFIKKIYKLFDKEIRMSFLGIVKKLGNGEDILKKDNNSSYFG
jgi:hypothetical protein